MSKRFLSVLICLCFVAGFNLAYYLVKAVSSAELQFDSDTIVSLSGISDGDLYIAENSECDSLSVLNSVLTVTDIPDEGFFILKTSTHDNALKITPSGGAITLTFDSGDLSSGNITEWTLDSSTADTEVTHIVGASLANTWYAISADNSHINSYQTNSSGELTFTYSDGFSSKTFTIQQDATAPTSFSLTSPANNSSTRESQPTFTWNASTDPDISYYQLYIDNAVDTDNISGTSQVSTNSLSCGNHTWYVTAVDSAGNSTNSSAFNLELMCGGGGIPGSISPQGANVPEPELQSIEDGIITYLDEIPLEPTVVSDDLPPTRQAPKEIQISTDIKDSIDTPKHTPQSYYIEDKKIPYQPKKEIVLEKEPELEKDIIDEEDDGGFINGVKKFFKFIGRSIIGFWRVVWVF